DRINLLPHLELHPEVFGDRLDHEVAVGEIAIVERRPDALADRIRVGLLGLALLHGAGQLLLDLPDAGGEPILIDLADHDLPSGLGADLADPVAHQAAAENSNLPDLHPGASRCSTFVGPERRQPTR